MNGLLVDVLLLRTRTAFLTEMVFVVDVVDFFVDVAIAVVVIVVITVVIGVVVGSVIFPVGDVVTSAKLFSPINPRMTYDTNSLELHICISM